MVNVSVEGVNVTSVPRFGRPSTIGAGPTTLSGATASPPANSIMLLEFVAPDAQHGTRLDSALTTETPTPCSPPETL